MEFAERIAQPIEHSGRGLDDEQAFRGGLHLVLPAIHRFDLGNDVDAGRQAALYQFTGDAAGFAESLARADLVLTGEGRIDGQTAFGKTALGVARRAQAAGVGCIAIGGGVEPDGIAALAAVRAIAVPVAERPQSVEDAMAAGTAPLERCGERLARLIGIGQGLIGLG